MLTIRVPPTYFIVRRIIIIHKITITIKISVYLFGTTCYFSIISSSLYNFINYYLHFRFRKKIFNIQYNDVIRQTSITSKSFNLYNIMIYD